MTFASTLASDIMYQTCIPKVFGEKADYNKHFIKINDCQQTLSNLKHELICLKQTRSE